MSALGPVTISHNLGHVAFSLSGTPQTVEELKSDDFFARIEDLEGERLLADVNQLQLTDYELQQISQDFLNAKIDVFPENYLPVAFLSYFKREINRNQLATLCLMCHVDPSSIRTIDHPDDRAQYQEAYDCDEIDMRTLKPLDKVFFVLETKTRNNPSIDTIIRTFSQRPTPKDTKFKYLLPSPQLIQETLKAKFGANAIKPNPVFGFSNDLKYWWDVKHRDVAIPCVEYFSQPKMIHIEKVVHPLDVYYHDVEYHLLIDSSNPHREDWINLANFLERQPDNLPNLQPILHHLLDRNAPEYFVDLGLTKEAVFIKNAIILLPVYKADFEIYIPLITEWLMAQDTFKPTDFCASETGSKSFGRFILANWYQEYTKKTN